MIWRFMKPQGAVGLAVSLMLFVLLARQTFETRHWRTAAERSEASFKAEQSAHAQTVANYRAAAERAREADAANLRQVASAQQAINQGSDHDFQARLDDARARAERLRGQADAGAGHPGRGGAAAVPGVPASSRKVAGPTDQDRLSLDDRLTATEQALQLDELIKWVKAQGAIDQGNERQLGATAP